MKYRIERRRKWRPWQRWRACFIVGDNAVDDALRAAKDKLWKLRVRSL